jgi:Cof subfamily protein (haloacid dehalogenase superfamily)
MVGLVASDIDGTLLRSDRTISPRTRQAVVDVEQAGIGFVLVTGRPPRWLAPVRDQIAHRGVAICANGALVMDLQTEAVLHSDPFAHDVGLEVVQALMSLDPDLGFGVEYADGFASGPGYPHGIRQSEAAKVAAHRAGTVVELFAKPVIKILARRPDGPLEDLIPAAVEALGGSATVTWSDLGLLEISAAGVTKASALARHSADLGVDAQQVIAFGDMPNDLPMLRWAGRAVAVGNAHPAVKEVADEVTAPNDDDGVAMVLERLLADRSAADGPGIA